MGYTHYWNWKKVPLLKDIRDILRPLIQHGEKKGILGNWSGEKPVPNYYRSSFNGLGENSHETFVPIEKPIRPEFKGKGFCKTARKPYDSYVVCALWRLKKVFGDNINLFSDGNEDEIMNGAYSDNISPLELYKEVYGEDPPENAFES